MRRSVLLLSIMFVVLGLFSYSFGASGGGNVYVIPIHGEIGPAVHQYLRDQIAIAEADEGAVGIIFEIDTYGGRVDSAVEMSRLMLGTTLPTISFVNTKAESAGVLLTISGDQIAMSPGSTIGSAEPIPNTEKTLSFWTSQLRTVAQEQGRNPELVAAMADSSIVIPEVVQEGRLLNLTTHEALELGFSDMTASGYEEILNEFGVGYSNIVVQPISAKVRLAQMVNSAYIAPILLAFGFIGIAIEILTAGFGVGGTISIIAFALYFGGSVLAGNAGWAVIIIFLTGILLLGIEAVIPGFGIPGLGGIVLIVLSIILASSSATTALLSILIALILTIGAIVLILKYAPRSKHFDRIILGTQMKKEQGYRSTEKYDGYIGQIGIVKTLLRPAGTMEINGEVLDVVSEGTFIERGTEVKVIRVEGRKVIVRKIN